MKEKRRKNEKTKLKPSHVKTDMPRPLKVKLWQLMKDYPTYTSWEKAVAKHDFDEDERNYLRTSRDSFKALKDEILNMPADEVLDLPLELQSWIKKLRPELAKECAIQGIKVPSKDEVCNIINDWLNYIRAANPEDISANTDFRVPDLVPIKLVWETVFPQRLREKYQRWEKDVANYLNLCKGLIAEIWKQGESWEGISLKHGFHRPILKRLRLRMEGKEIEHKITIQTLIRKGNIQEMDVDGYTVAEGQELLPCSQQYCLLSDSIVNSVRSFALIDALRKLRSLEDEICNEAQEVLRQYSEYKSESLSI